LLVKGRNQQEVLMGKVVLHMSMSLDGYIAGPNVGVDRPMGEGGERLHEWLSTGSHSDPRDAEVAAEMFATATTGAVVMGMRTFTVGEGPWGDDGTFAMPCFVLTHEPKETLVRGATTFTFVTDGIDSALAQANAAAGDKDINLMGADTAQQFLSAGLLDEIQINLIPIVLGDGVRLFEYPATKQIELERTRVIESAAVTHLKFRVRK
jgi:dihydrofolate reductase